MSPESIDPGSLSVSKKALDVIFLEARTHRAWSDEKVSNELLVEIYESMKFGPTSSNSNPFRCLFLTTDEAKERILPAMAEGNREKTRTSPVVAIFALDEKFHEQMDELMPGRDMKATLEGNPQMAKKIALQGATLQAGYFMIVARAYGLDCGPMGGFDAEKVNQEFFQDSSWKVTFICNLGHGDPSKLQPRLPRLSFEKACKIL